MMLLIAVLAIYAMAMWYLSYKARP